MKYVDHSDFFDLEKHLNYQSDVEGLHKLQRVPILDDDLYLHISINSCQENIWIQIKKHT